MPPQELSTYIVPQLFGLSRMNYKDPGEIKVFYWGEMPFTQTADYVGLLPLALMGIAIIKCRITYVRVFLFIAIFFQVVAMGKYTPVYPLFYEHLGFKFFRVPKMNLFVVAFSASIMAAYGAEWLLNSFGEKDKEFHKRVLFFIVGFAAVLSALVLYGKLNPGGPISYFMSSLLGHGESYNPSLVVQRYECALEGIWKAAALLLVCAAVLAFRLVDRINRKTFFAFLLGFFLIDISMLNSKFIDAIPMDDNAYFSKDAANRYFERDKGLFRVLNYIEDRSMESIPYRVPNKYILYKIHSATGYEAVGNPRYNEFLKNMDLEGNLVDLLNIKYLVMEKSRITGVVGNSVGKYDIVVDDDIKILRNRNVMPRVFPVHKARVASDKEELLSRLNDASFEPRKEVLLEEQASGHLSPFPKPETDSKVDIISYENDEIKLDARMVDNGFVVLSEKHYPGWKAYLDNKQVNIYLADYIFRAVYVPEGAHIITFRYEADSYKKGLYITIASLLIVAFSIVRYFYLKRNNQK